MAPDDRPGASVPLLNADRMARAHKSAGGSNRTRGAATANQCRHGAEGCVNPTRAAITAANPRPQPVKKATCPSVATIRPSEGVRIQEFDGRYLPGIG
jgi:hypothetical protein